MAGKKRQLAINSRAERRRVTTTTWHHHAMLAAPPGAAQHVVDDLLVQLLPETETGERDQLRILPEFAGFAGSFTTSTNSSKI